MLKFRNLTKFVTYFLKSRHKKGYGVHSPFLFELITHVFSDKIVYPEFHTIQMLRKQLLKSGKTINHTDFGAVFSTIRKYPRKVKTIVRNSSVPKKYGELLFRLVHYFSPQTILELGTSLGISSFYLALANPDGNVITIEGCPETSGMAEKNFIEHQLFNIQIRNGNFDDILPETLKTLKNIDFALIDGNHKKDATIAYFNQILPKIKNETIIVIDDIYWSEDMEEAWETIKKMPQVTLSIDIFRMGIVFFKKELTKQNFIIRY